MQRIPRDIIPHCGSGEAFDEVAAAHFPHGDKLGPQTGRDRLTAASFPLGHPTTPLLNPHLFAVVKVMGQIFHAGEFPVEEIEFLGTFLRDHEAGAGP